MAPPTARTATAAVLLLVLSVLSAQLAVGTTTPCPPLASLLREVERNASLQDTLVALVGYAAQRGTSLFPFALQLTPSQRCSLSAAEAGPRRRASRRHGSTALLPYSRPTPPTSGARR